MSNLVPPVRNADEIMVGDIFPIGTDEDHNDLLCVTGRMELPSVNQVCLRGYRLMSGIEEAFTVPADMRMEVWERC